MISFALVQNLVKYLLIGLLLLTYPAVRFVLKNNILQGSNAIYDYVPQDCDAVVEINTRNFISEILYQRIYNEVYFNNRVFGEEEEELEEDSEKVSQNIGIDFFSKIVIFRELWADESIWFGVFPIQNKKSFQKFAERAIQTEGISFNRRFAFVQLTPSQDQKSVQEHLEAIKDKKVNSIQSRFDLAALFKKEKEINCLIIPENLETSYQLLDGYMAFDFLDDRIAIDGEFTPKSSIEDLFHTTYKVDPDRALSFRTTLNISEFFKNTKDTILSRMPRYQQLVIDYNGIELKLIDQNAGLNYPIKKHPDFQLQLNVDNKLEWLEFYERVIAQYVDKINLLKRELIFIDGTFVRFELDKDMIVSRQREFVLESEDADNIYLDLSLNFVQLIEGVLFSIDEEYPPSEIEQKFGIRIGNQIMGEIKKALNLKHLRFKLFHDDQSDKIKAEGEIRMKEENSNATVESIYLGNVLGALVNQMTQTIPSDQKNNTPLTKEEEKAEKKEEKEEKKEERQEEKEEKKEERKAEKEEKKEEIQEENK